MVDDHDSYEWVNVSFRTGLPGYSQIKGQNVCCCCCWCSLVLLLLIPVFVWLVLFSDTVTVCWDRTCVILIAQRTVVKNWTVLPSTDINLSESPLIFLNALATIGRNSTSFCLLSNDCTAFQFHLATTSGSTWLDSFSRISCLLFYYLFAKIALFKNIVRNNSSAVNTSWDCTE